VVAATKKSPLKILLVDGTNTLYRAFFAIPHLRAPDGSPTNAAYGMINTLTKVIREEQPDRVVVVFDARGPTFRHKLYDQYKANREAQPEDLSSQFPMIRELIEAHRFPIVSVPDFEADDVIATLVDRAPAKAQISIVSTDKDMMQLVSDRVTMLDGVQDRRYGPAEVEQRFGVAPSRILDLRSLVGDPSDNIPGVKGIGEKGAAKLIEEFGTLENLIEKRDQITAKRSRTALESQIDEALLSKRLATLRTDVPLPQDLDSPLEAPDPDVLRELYTRLGFVRLVAALDSDSPSEPTASQRFGPVAVDRIEDEAGLQRLTVTLGKLSTVPMIAIVEQRDSDGGDRIAGEPVGLAFGLGADRAAYLALRAAPDELFPSLPIERVATALEPIFGDLGTQAPPKTRWMSSDAKLLQILFGECGVELATPHFDVAIAAHLIDPAGANGVPSLAERYLGCKTRSWEEVAGRGAKAVAARDIPIELLAGWAAEEVCAVHALYDQLQSRIAADGLTLLSEQIELPLSGVLAHMQIAGVRIDEALLDRLAEEWSGTLDGICSEIYQMAGEEFLISSPKQLQRILFEKLKLPPVKKTKTGLSTDESVLEQLALQHPLPLKILEFRKLSKLRSTYVVALPPLVNGKTGRIHPTFNQLGAATGRLSATHPNVQNIPIRSQEGIRIREAFIPAEGKLLLSADYSQVELRILAHFSGDESLLDAFSRGDDVHRRTASEVAGIPIESVTDDQRARAKAVNFGIIYGQSSFGLANQLGIASADAKATIDAYFARYGGVRTFIDESIEGARKSGYVETLFGRRRYLPDLGSRNRTLRQAAERMAVNTIIQGTAADLIKKAMVNLDPLLDEAELDAVMILQVHDELVFEVPKRHVEALTSIVTKQMEGVSELRVPLLVDVGTGANWREAH
jgi:DNA polymerase-1